jgi:hypothetical protein
MEAMSFFLVLSRSKIKLRANTMKLLINKTSGCVGFILGYQKMAIQPIVLFLKF